MQEQKLRRTWVISRSDFTPVAPSSSIVVNSLSLPDASLAPGKYVLKVFYEFGADQQKAALDGRWGTQEETLRVSADARALMENCWTGRLEAQTDLEIPAR